MNLFYGLFLFLMCFCHIRSHKDENPILILISFDGFRWDYLEKTNTAFLTSLADNGARATVLNNFVTKTFPNHYSIVTGMYEERHGIINNYMYDPVLNESFKPGNVDPRWFNAAEPIWITNEKYGDERLSAVVNWIGCSVPINGKLPHFTMPYNHTMPYKTRIDYIVNKLDKEPPANFLAAYFEEPDASGHKYGPDSKHVIKAIQEVDKIAGYLIQKLKARKLFDKVNIIFTSDHGMSEVNRSTFIYLDQYIRSESYQLVGYGVNVFLIPHTDEDKHSIYKNLSKVPHISVYYKEDIPDYWHYRNNRRVTPIFIASHKGYKIFPSFADTSDGVGDHGYNNSFPDMHPFFIAHGPAFKQGYISPSFSIVHIYSLMCYLLGVSPAPNDGNFEAVSHMLQPNVENYLLFSLLMAIALVVILIVLIGTFQNVRRKSGLTKHVEEDELLVYESL